MLLLTLYFKTFLHDPYLQTLSCKTPVGDWSAGIERDAVEEWT